jgi:hypothetical protein
MFITKKQKAHIRGIAEEEWFIQVARRSQMREREALNVRERVIKRISRDYKVESVLGTVLFALAVKFAAKVIEDMLRDYFKKETTDERK